MTIKEPWILILIKITWRGWHKMVEFRHTGQIIDGQKYQENKTIFDILPKICILILMRRVKGEIRIILGLKLGK
jgi:hypothetical protein